jgi:hypothetical protein
VEAAYVKEYLDTHFKSRYDKPKTLIDWQIDLTQASHWNPKEFKVKQ